MSKMKKLLALMMTVIMVMAMGMTSFAAGTTAKITVNNADDAELKMIQIIEPDQTTATGWKFKNGAGTYFVQAFAPQTDEQMILASLIKMVTPDATFTNTALNAATAATAAQFDNALSKVASNIEFGEFQENVSNAGVYAITATEEGYTYKTMAAYVGFGVAPSLTDAEPITAKKAPTTVTKSVDDPDKVVAIGDEVTYTVSTSVPYIDPNATNKTFKIFDTLTGGEYLDFTTADNFKVTLDGKTYTYEANKLVVTNGNSFVLDLGALIDSENSNAGKAVVVTYKAKVTEVTAENGAGSNVGDSEYSSEEVKVFTGKITLTKYAEDGTTTLADAGFKVNKDGSEAVLKFDEKEAGKYVYNPDGSIEEVFTDSEGKLVVEGLDKGTYHFTETTAPEGYSINANGANATLAVEGDEATAIINAETSLTDTKLSALPGTGGIGTTIFTIGGCVIMIAAAALFFASRKKEQK